MAIFSIRVGDLTVINHPSRGIRKESDASIHKRARRVNDGERGRRTVESKQGGCSD